GVHLGANGDIAATPLAGDGLLRGRDGGRPGQWGSVGWSLIRVLRPSGLHARGAGVRAGDGLVRVRQTSWTARAASTAPWTRIKPYPTPAESAHHALRTGLAGSQRGARCLAQHRTVSGRKRA